MKNVPWASRPWVTMTGIIIIRSGPARCWILRFFLPHSILQTKDSVLF